MKNVFRTSYSLAVVRIICSLLVHFHSQSPRRHHQRCVERQTSLWRSRWNWRTLKVSRMSRRRWRATFPRPVERTVSGCSTGSRWRRPSASSWRSTVIIRSSSSPSWLSLTPASTRTALRTCPPRPRSPCEVPHANQRCNQQFISGGGCFLPPAPRSFHSFPFSFLALRFLLSFPLPHSSP